MQPKTVSRILTLAAVVAIASTNVAVAQTASAILHEDDPVPGFPGQTISAINNPAVNHVGGYATTLTSVGSKTLSHIWGNATGGPGAVIITEGVYAGYEQTSFESFNGFSDAGDPAYSAISNSLVTGSTSLDGVWVGTTPILVEEDPIPTLPGFFSTFNSRPGITATGSPYWGGGYSTVQGGSTQQRALFFGAGLLPVIKTGDPVGGVPELVDVNLDFDFRFSQFGTNWIHLVIVDASSTIDGVVVSNGNALMLGGGIVREGSPVPAGVGGLPGENWDNFDFFGINEAGAFFFTGDTDATTSMDEFVVAGGQIALREGDVVATASGPATLSGSIEGGFANEDGDWAVIWDVDLGPDNLEVLLFNGEPILLEGDDVDWDNDGTVDPGSKLANFTGISTLVISDRDASGMVEIYFTADIDFNGTSSSSDDLEGLMRMVVQTEVPGIELFADIKPGSCPNPFNQRSNGVVPVSVLGTMDFDVTQIDVSTLFISRADGVGGTVAPNEGPQGPHTVYEDTGTPYEDDIECGCHRLMGDGFIDLSMHFPSAQMGTSLGLDALDGGTLVELTVRGNLLDGTPFFAPDCVILVPRRNGPDDNEEINPGGGGGTFSRGGSGGSTPPVTVSETEISDQDDPAPEPDPDRNLEVRLRRLTRMVDRMDEDHAGQLYNELRHLRDEAATQGNLEMQQRAERLLRRVDSARQ